MRFVHLPVAASFAALAIAGCAGPDPGVVETLLSPADIERVSDVTEFWQIVKHPLPLVAEANPESVEHIESWEQLLIGNSEQTRGLVLDVIRFDGESAAADHADRVMADIRWLELASPVGDQSAYRDLEGPHISGVLLFRKSEWYVSLRTEHGEGFVPMFDRSGFEALAAMIADRLPPSP